MTVTIRIDLNKQKIKKNKINNKINGWTILSLSTYCRFEEEPQKNDLLAESSPFHARVTSGFPISRSIWQMIAFLLFQIGKIPEQLIQATRECEQHQWIDKEEFNNIDDHSTQRYLQWTQMRIDRKQMH